MFLAVGASATFKILPETATLTSRETSRSDDTTITIKATVLPPETAAPVKPAGTSQATKNIEIQAQYTLIQAEKGIEAVSDTVDVDELAEKYTQAEAQAKDTAIEITNTGKIAVKLKNPGASTNFTIVEFPKDAIPEGETATIKVRPRTGRKLGPYADEFTFDLDPSDRNVEPVKVTVTMTVVAHETAVDLATDAVVFDDAEVGYEVPAAKEIVVENKGNGEAKIALPTLESFEVTEIDKNPIQAGEKATLKIVPKVDLAAKADAYSESFAIETEDGFTTEKTVTVSFKVVAKNGWKEEEGGYRYYKDSVAVENGWEKVDGHWYYFKDTIMQTGWIQVNGKYYYLKSWGGMATGWVKDGNIWYYMNSDGSMKTGWLQLNNKWYYLKSWGGMAVGWVKDGNTWYFMNEDGSMKTGWHLASNGTWYWLKGSGAMAANESVAINGKTYNFDASGACTNP